MGKYERFGRLTFKKSIDWQNFSLIANQIYVFADTKRATIALSGIGEGIETWFERKNVFMKKYDAS